jgi:hypothetical protein
MFLMQITTGSTEVTLADKVEVKKAPPPPPKKPRRAPPSPPVKVVRPSVAENLPTWMHVEE